MNESAGKRRHILISGGAGYIGSALTHALLARGDWVSVLDRLDFGGESLLACCLEPRFHFERGDLLQPGALQACARRAVERGAPPVESVVHLAAMVGFPACKRAGRERAWEANVEATKRAFAAAEALGAARFLFASTYSVYGRSADGRPLGEESPLDPQSLYGETKIAAEQHLREAGAGSSCAPLIFRFATLYGLSPRMRFDLIVNQFALEAYARKELLIYQREYSRSFVHLQDVLHGIELALDAPADSIRAETLNLGTEAGNLSKEEVVDRIRRALPETVVRYEDMDVAGDMRDVLVSFERVRQKLGFKARRRVEQGIDEILALLASGLIEDPFAECYRNAPLIVQ